MATIDRVRVAWSGGIGGAGVSTFYFASAVTVLADVRGFFAEFASYIPVGITLTIENVGDKISDVDGALVGTWTAPSVLPIPCSNPSVYAGPAGLCVTWLTDLVTDRHRVKGRTFIVPIGSDRFDAQGSISPGALSAATATALAFRNATAPGLLVWHRPRAARAATASSPAVAFRPGSSTPVVGSNIRDQAAVLRSRRS